MKVTLIIIIVFLIVIICIQHSKSSKTSKDIKYIIKTLQGIMENHSTERIKLFTSDDEMKQLLTSINELLDYNNDNITKYNKSKISMKKMLSNISHDLKTPLTVILGYVEMLKLKSEEKVMADKIYEKAEEVLDLINNFFDLARIESGDKKIQISKVNICEICRTTILNFYDTLHKENIEVLIDIPKKDIFVLGNEEAIVRILNNLIFNAISYGGSGKYLGLVINDEEAFVHIKVIDKGKGIEEKYKEEVFERIFTLEDSRSKSYQGSGLGLTITKSLVEALGGNIYVDSLPNVKTIFSFTLNKLNY